MPTTLEAAKAELEQLLQKDAGATLTLNEVAPFAKQRAKELRQWLARWQDKLRAENWNLVVRGVNVEFHVWRPEGETDADREFIETLTGRQRPCNLDIGADEAEFVAEEPRQTPTLSEIARTDRATVKAVIDGLTNAQREVCAAYFVEGKTQAETAQQTHRTEPLVCEMIGRIKEAFTAAGLPAPDRPRRGRQQRASHVDPAADWDFSDLSPFCSRSEEAEIRKKIQSWRRRR